MRTTSKYCIWVLCVIALTFFFLSFFYIRNSRCVSKCLLQTVEYGVFKDNRLLYSLSFIVDDRVGIVNVELIVANNDRSGNRWNGVIEKDTFDKFWPVVLRASKIGKSDRLPQTEFRRKAIFLHYSGMRFDCISDHLLLADDKWVRNGKYTEPIDAKIADIVFRLLQQANAKEMDVSKFSRHEEVMLNGIRILNEGIKGNKGISGR